MFLSVLVLFVIFQSNVFGYIDPGTGSLLFSALFGIIGTLFFLSKALLIKLKTMSFSKNKSIETEASKKARIIIYGEDKRYCNVFKPIIEELIKLETPVIYYSSSEDDPIFEIKNDLLHAEFIGVGNKAYAKLNFIEADICLMTTPNLDVFQLKRSKGVKKYVHIVHSPVIPLYRLYSLDFFDSILINGNHQEEYIRELEKLRRENPKEVVIVGSSYLDELDKKKKQLNLDSIEADSILLSPSWGDNALLIRYGSKLIDELLKTNMNIIIRPHPQSLISEKGVLDNLQDIYKDKKNIEWDFSVDNIISFSRSKIMISDFSGVIFDYTFLFERPVLIPEFKFDKSIYDIAMLKDEIWTFKVLPKISIHIEESDFGNIGNIISNAVNSDNIIKNIRDIRKEAYMYQGEASKYTAKYIKNSLDNMVSIVK